MARYSASVASAKAFYAAVVLIFPLLCSSVASTQISVVTQHYDNARTGQNTQETILTPANVNSIQFGKLFTQSLDGQMPGQPLYVPNVFIPALNSTHNVVYAATMHDSVYAFDADDNQGSNASPLWYVNFLDPANGVTSVPLADENCGIAGYTEFGIQGTPVIDTTPTINAIFVLAMTLENGTYVHRLHALDLGTGEELFGGPVTIAASVVVEGQTYNFIDRYQQQRPGLLLQGGNIYIGFGSAGCNIKTENGWVMAYGETSLQQVGAFDVSPGVDASAVWLSGGGIAGDGQGNIYFSTGDGLFDGPGGTHYGDSVIELNQGDGVLNLASYFTPYNQLYFQQNDLDVSSGLVQLLPEQPDGSNFVLAIDKNGTAYLLNQNNLGGYDAAGDFQIPQELDVPVSGEVHAGLTYWNNTIYIAAYSTPVMAYSFANDQISLQPISQTPAMKGNPHPQGGIVSANGTQNGIFWFVSNNGSNLYAYDANNLATEYYDNSMMASRDTLGTLVHFGMPVVANGKLYVNGATELAVFGLLPALAPVTGNNQTAVVGTTLPLGLQARLENPYNGNAIDTAGVPVTFKASAKGGSLSNLNTTTNRSGIASTNYTLPKTPGTYTITASSSGYASATFTETAIAGSPATISITSGNKQSAQVSSSLPLALAVTVKDGQGNKLTGISVTFSDGGAGGKFSPASATSDSSGVASTSYITSTQPGTVQITASTTGVASVEFKETVLVGSPASMAIYSGNNQNVKTGKTTGSEVRVIVEDQYGNPVPGVSVTYSDGGAGGSFSSNPALTGTKGQAGTSYTAPQQEGAVTVTASSSGLPSVLFTVNVN
jgi:hypothetical protein